jgi:hypothetical protein
MGVVFLGLGDQAVQSIRDRTGCDHTIQLPRRASARPAPATTINTPGKEFIV